MIQYLAIGLIAITTLIVLINVIKGLIRGLKKTIGTLVAIILSAVIATIVTSILCNPESSIMAQLFSALEGLLGTSEINDVLSIVEIKQAISLYVSMIVAPFVFFILYAVLSIIMAIIVAIIVKFIPPHKKPKPVVHRLGGAGVGLVCGLLVTMLVLMPVAGVINIAGNVGQSSMISNAESEDEMTQMLGEISDNKVIGIYGLSSGWLFDYFASAIFDGEKIYLKDDIAVIISMIDHVEALSGNVTEMGEEEIQALEALVEDLDASPLLKHTLAGFISNMAGKWISGETFMGMAKIDAGELLNPIIDRMLTVIATSDKNNLTGDMTTLVDILGIMQRSGILANSGDYDKTLEVLGEGDVISELIITANKNERMIGLSDEISQLSIRTLASAIGIPADDNDRYNQLLSDIAGTINESDSKFGDEKTEYVKAEVSDALDIYGVEISGEAADDIAKSIVADFNGRNDVVADDVKEFFAIYAIATSPELYFNRTGHIFDVLASGDDIKINKDGTISIGDYVFRNYNANNYKSSSAYKMGQSGVDLGYAADLYSADLMGKTWEDLGVINLDDLLSDTHPDDGVHSGIKKYSECVDKDAAARDVADMIKEALSMADSDFENMEQAEMLEKISVVLDKMKDAEIYEDATPDILKAILQSSTVRGSLKMHMSDMNNFADKLNQNAKATSYAEVTKSISHTVDMLKAVSDENMSMEDRRQTTMELLDNMTPENAELLSTMTTPSMIKEYVADEEKAETVSDSVTNLFTNMADFKTNNPDATDDDYQREADAVNTVLNLAVDGAESENKPLFNTEPGDSTGKVDATAYEYVELVVTSDVVSKTVRDTLDENPDGNPYGINPSDDDSEQLSTALVDYYNDNADPDGDNSELVDRLNSIAEFTNITMPELG